MVLKVFNGGQGRSMGPQWVSEAFQECSRGSLGALWAFHTISGGPGVFQGASEVFQGFQEKPWAFRGFKGISEVFTEASGASLEDA